MMSGDGQGQGGKEPVERVLDVFVHTPIGLAVLAWKRVPEMVTAVPDLVGQAVARGCASLAGAEERISEEVRKARMIGQVAVTFGGRQLRKEVDARLRDARQTAGGVVSFIPGMGIPGESNGSGVPSGFGGPTGASGFGEPAAPSVSVAETPTAAASPPESPAEPATAPRSPAKPTGARKAPAKGSTRSSAKTPAKSAAKSPAKSAAKSPAKSAAKSAAKSPGKSAAKSPAKSAAKSAAKSPAKTSAQAQAIMESLVESADRAGAAGAAPTGSTASAADLPIREYDGLSASQVVSRLTGLPPDELRAVRSYEAASRGRRTVLLAIDRLLT